MLRRSGERSAARSVVKWFPGVGGSRLAAGPLCDFGHRFQDVGDVVARGGTSLVPFSDDVRAPLWNVNVDRTGREALRGRCTKVLHSLLQHVLVGVHLLDNIP
jgi:hypothetical protein